MVPLLCERLTSRAKNGSKEVGSTVEKVASGDGSDYRKGWHSWGGKEGSFYNSDSGSEEKIDSNIWSGIKGSLLQMVSFKSMKHTETVACEVIYVLNKRWKLQLCTLNKYRFAFCAICLEPLSLSVSLPLPPPLSPSWHVLHCFGFLIFDSLLLFTLKCLNIFLSLYKNTFWKRLISKQNICHTFQY